MHALTDTSRAVLIGGLMCVFFGQLLWFVAGGVYNSLCCLARGQRPLSWLRQITFVHFHALLPPVRDKARISPRVLKDRYPSAPWLYHAAALGMFTEMIGLFIVLMALGFEAAERLGRSGVMPGSIFDG